MVEGANEEATPFSALGILMMRFLFSCFLVAAINTNPLDAAAPIGAPDDRQALRTAKLETWPGLYASQDADGLDAFLADDFVMIAADGSLSPKTAEVEWLRNNRWRGAEDFAYVIEDVVFLSRDAAIVYGYGQSTGADSNGAPCAHRYVSSNIFRRDGAHWRPVLSHLSGERCETIGE